MLWALTRGHPYYAMALMLEVYRARRATRDLKSITETDFTVQLVRQAAEGIERGLTHSWDQVSPPQNALGWALARLGAQRDAVGAIFDPEKATATFSIEDVAGVLKQQGSEISKAELGGAVLGLERNYVIEESTTSRGHHRLRSPFLGVWLASNSLEELDPDTRGEEEQTSKTGSDLLEEALAAEEAGNTIDADALLRRAYKVSPRQPQILFHAARFAARDGSLIKAAALLRQARLRGDSPEVQTALAEVLERQISTAIERGDNPLDAWNEFRQVARLSGSRLSPERARDIVDWHGRLWRDAIEHGRYQEAEAAIRTVERHAGYPVEDLPRWRARMLEHYLDFMRTHPESRGRRSRCLAAVPFGLLILTERTVAEEFGLGTDRVAVTEETNVAALPPAVRAVVHGFAPGVESLDQLTPEQREGVQRLLREFPKRLQVPSTREAPDPKVFWDTWRLTMDVIRACAEDDPSSFPLELSANAFTRLLHRTPTELVTNLEELLSSVLPRIAGADIGRGESRAQELLHLLREIRPASSLDLGPVLAAVEEQVILRLEQGSHQAVVGAYRSLPGVLSILLSQLRHDGRPWLMADDALELAQVVVGRARQGHGEQSWKVIADYPEDTSAWKSLVTAARGFATAEATRSLADELLEQLTLPAEFAPLLKPAADDFLDDREEVAAVKKLLDPAFFRVHSLAGATGTAAAHRLVKRFRGSYRPHPGGRWEDTDIKVFRIPMDDEPTARFLEALWAHERRVLSDIGSRKGGRAFAELRTADFRIRDGVLVLATEPVGSTTLRELLTRRLAMRWRTSFPDILWREIHAVMQALQILHEAHFLHRGLRPETIRVSSVHESVDTSPTFKLADFEWSIYLHSMFGEHGFGRRLLDYYLAPEVLLAELDQAGAMRGESFASDIYALGLVLFELLVRPLSTLELCEFRDRQAYSTEQHREWLLGLRDEVRDPNNGLEQSEQLVLLRMLHFDARKRTTDLRTPLNQAKLFALGASDLQSQLDLANLSVVATLDPQTQDSIARYIARYPGVSLTFDTVAETKAFIEHELKGADVFENGTNAGRPLYLVGKTVNFTARPFEANGVQHRRLAYLWAATPLDSPTDEPLVRLEQGVTAESLLPEGERLEHLGRHGSELWQRLFELVCEAESRLSPGEQQEHALFHQALQVTGEAEAELLEQLVVPYSIVDGPKYSASGRLEVLRIGPRRVGALDDDDAWRADLRTMVAQQSQLSSPNFELSSRRSTSDWVVDAAKWQAENVDSEDNEVTLARRVLPLMEPPPQEGWIRPGSLLGYQVLLARRRSLLRRLVGDRHVLRAVTRPTSAHHQVPVEGLEFFLELDDDKERIVKRTLEIRPLLMVKGPPGTGKTTLATEVILQTLRASPSARILVTAQGHDPLNNLLQTVSDQIDRHRPTKRRPGRLPEPLQVRLVPERRLTETTDTEAPGRAVEGRFHPSRVADTLLQQSLHWRPRPEQRVDASLLHNWEQFVLRQRRWTVSDAFQRRLIDSANVVYATANDRTIEDSFRFERPFDLLIFEEAARALPLELLAPMVNAPRWLLIGDPDQLPPHDLEAMKRVISAGFSGARRAADPQAETLRTERRFKALEIIEFFSHLYSKDLGSRLRDGASDELIAKGLFTDGLTIQYRAHPTIAECVSKTYYGGTIRSGDEDRLKQKKVHRVITPEEFRGRSIVWIDLPWVGDPDVPAHLSEEPSPRGGYTNHAEIHVVQRLLAIENWKMKGYGGFRENEFVFLSPYRAQIDRFNKVFESWTGSHTGRLQDSAYTVDSFQGRQADIVFVSLVRNNPRPGLRGGLGFLSNPARSVVMFSRAQRLLIIVGCSAHFCRFPSLNSPIRRFYEHVCELTGPTGGALLMRGQDLFEDKSFKMLDEHWRRREQYRQDRQGNS